VLDTVVTWFTVLIGVGIERHLHADETTAAGLAMVEAARFWLPPCWSHKLSTVLVKVKIDVLVNEVVVSVDVTVLR